MSERFLKFIPSEEAIQFAIKYKNAFVLLLIIANQARRTEGASDGLKMGQCHIGNHKNYGMSEKEYRYAKEILIKNGLIKIVLTSRTRKKAKNIENPIFGSNGANAGANEPTTTATLVELCNSAVWDINYDIYKHSKCERKGERKGESRANEGRTKGDKQERLRMIKNDKKDHPSIPSKKSDRLIDDFSFEKEKIQVCDQVFMTQEEIDACVKIKGDLDNVKKAVEYILSSPRRKNTITDWPNALLKWKIEDKSKTRVQDNLAYSENLFKEFAEFTPGNGWRCREYNNSKKDCKGILFENQSPYHEPFFVSFSEEKLIEKCEEFIKTKNMRKQ